MSSQIWYYLIFSGYGGGVGGSGVKKIKVAQNDLKHILVLEFLRTDEFLKFCV